MLALLVAAASYIVFAYILPALLARLTVWLPAKIELDAAMGEAAAVPSTVAAFLDDRTSVLAGLGFSTVAAFGIRLAQQATSWHRVMSNPRTLEHGTVTVIIIPVGRNSRRVLLSCSTEYQTFYDNGRRLATNNGCGLHFRLPAELNTHAFPGLVDLKLLHRLHTRLTESFDPPSRRRLPAPEEIPALALADHDAYCSILEQHGFLTRRPGGEFYRLTWKACMIQAWNRRWPGSAIRRRLEDRRVSRVLGEPPPPGGYVRESYPRWVPADGAVCRSAVEESPGSGAGPQEGRLPIFCPNCDYRVSHLPSPQCPECGSSLDRPALEAGARSRESDMRLGTILRGLLGPPSLLVLVVLFGAAVSLAGQWFEPLQGLCRRIGVAIVLGAFVAFCILALSSSYRAATRWSIRRARRQGWNRSGLKDRGFIRTTAWTLALLQWVFALSALLGFLLLTAP